MLGITGGARLFLYAKAVSMRKSFEGLSALVEEGFPNKLMTGAYFIFINRVRTHVKILYWDGDGFAIWCKRLEKGRFTNLLKQELDRREFLMLMEGIKPKRLQVRYKYS